MYWTFFWISSFFVLAVTCFIFWGMFRRGQEQELDHNLEIAFLKNQLLQIDKDKKHDLTNEEDEFLATAISRKIQTLSHNETQNEQLNKSSNKINILVSIYILVMCLVGTVSIYKITSDNFLYFNKIVGGKNKNKDLPPNVLSQEIVEQNVWQTSNKSALNKSTPNTDSLANLVKELKSVLANRPDDLKGHKLLVKNSASLGDFITARKAQKNVLRLLKSNAKSSDYANYAELCVIAASGYVSLEARNALEQAILLDNNNSQANFYFSLLLLQSNKETAAFQTWIKLLKTEPSPSRWVTMLIPQISQISADLGKKMNYFQQSNSKLLSSRLIFLEVLEVLEKRLDKYGGSRKIWTTLIQSYLNLEFPEKAEITFAKVRTKFFLSNKTIEEIMRNIE